MPDPANLIPSLGYYKITLVKGGVMVPVWVFEEGERDPETGEPLEDITLHVELNNSLVSDEKTDKWLERIALFGTAIPKSEYDYMIADLEYVKLHEPDDPKAQPGKPVDLSKAKPLF